MDTRQFASFAADGARNYFDYLEAECKGREEIKVDRIDVEDAVYLLHTSKNPFSTDAVIIVIGEREYSQQELVVIQQDRDRRILYVRVSKGIVDPFVGKHAHDVRIVSDLKFLVQRVKDWYTENKGHLCFPCKAPLLHFDHTIQQDMSEGQISAVHDVFSHAQSYIWGAPGTGKTRYVLAECLLQYIRAGKRIAVIAPTNNAIEQVLYGLLDKLQTHDVPLEHIIRLGTPTARFAEQYGAICEVQGINKRLAELQKQIAFLQSILHHRDFLARLKYTEATILSDFHQITELLGAMQERNRDDKAASSFLKACARNMQALRAEQMRAEQAMNAQKRHMQSMGYRIGSKLSSTTSREGGARLVALTKEAEQCHAQFNAASIQYEHAKQTAEETQAHANAIDRQIDQAIRETKAHLNSIARFRAIGKELNRTNAPDCMARILDFVNAGRKAQMEGLERYAAYSQQSNSDINKRIREIKEDKKFLEAQSTQSRLEKAQVVASTVDTFLFRIQPHNTEKFIQFDHIFLDEAGYCSLIKGMTLFGYHCPVTMLGDHMQLSPVCEMDDAQFDKPSHRGAFLFAQSALYVEEAANADNEQMLYCQYTQHETPSFQVFHRSNLCETYRFGSSLADILEQYVYQIGFKSADDTREFEIEVLHVKRRPGKEKRQNPAEANAIGARIPFLATVDYAILSPYKNQVRLIGEILPQERSAQRIMTIHASQGREWDTVILSIVDTTDMYFTNTQRPEIGGLQIINTAVSRARHRLIIVCDAEFWQQQEGQLIRELVRLAE